MRDKGVDRAGRRVAKGLAGRPIILRQGKITDFDTFTKTLTATIEGANYANIKYADSVTPLLNAGVWIADMGGGRWLALAVTS